MTAGATSGSRRAWLATGAAVAIVAVLPFLRGSALGASFYFRDLARQFFPLRQFALEGLASGELRYWNPLVHEGEPAPPPLSYLPDLLQALSPDPAGLSLSLALHVPLAAVAFLFLGRGLGLSPPAAAAGSLIYALGGFSLSSLNLYVHLQALAWSPLLVLGLLRAAEGGRRQVAASAALTAVTLSTTGVEVAAQAILVGLALASTAGGRPRWPRLVLALVLGLGLSAPTLFYLGEVAAESARSAGFGRGMALAFSVHPLTLPQLLIAAWHGDPADPLNRFWGGNFSPGFPYFLSFYLGATALSLAGVGSCLVSRFRRRLAFLALLALLVCLGPWARLDLLLEWLPALRAFRFPSKAFFTLHFAAALLAAHGAEFLIREPQRRAWRLLGAIGLTLGMPLLAAPLLPRLLPAATRWFLGGFLPPEYSWPRRLEIAELIAADATRGGLVALGLAALALAVLQRRLSHRLAVPIASALLAADLLRAGAGLNPMVDVDYFRLSPETSRLLPVLRRSGRVFSCDPGLSRAAAAVRREHPVAERDLWSLATHLEALVPAFNVPHGLASAFSRDLTMLGPQLYALSPLEAGCFSFPAIVDRLRRGGVGHVVSVEPLSHPDLEPVAVLQPRRTAPLATFVYALRETLPLREVASTVRGVASRAAATSLARQPGFLSRGGAAVEGFEATVSGAQGRVLRTRESSDRLWLEVEADRPTVLVIRDAYAPGWRARVNGRPARVRRSDGRHRAIEIGRGRSEVLLYYSPTSLRVGLAAFGISLAAALLLARGAPPRVGRAETGR